MLKTRFRFVSTALTVSLIGGVFALSCAKAAPETNASVNILSEQTEALEKQMKSLQSQLQQLKQQQAALVSAPSKEAKSKLKPKQTTPSHSSKPTLFGVRGKEASKTDGDKQIPVSYTHLTLPTKA